MKKLCVLLALVACGPRDIIVVNLPPSEDGGFVGPALGCSSSSECAPNEFCEKSSCAQIGGHCRPKPPFCMPILSPVCGCNGVNYWNDCHRKQQGIAANSENDQCSAPATCSAASPCPDPEASCTLLLPRGSSCAAAPAGVCWFAPSNCPPPTTDEGRWETCAGPLSCGGFCAAIHSGAVRRNVDSCP